MRLRFADEDKPLETNSLLEAARQVARRRKTQPELLDLLKRWWTEKYKLPWNHKLFLDSTEFELATEFFLDKYYEQPLEAYRQEDGTIKFTDTGDPLIDKWEQELAEGKTPEYLEAFSPEELEKLVRLRERGRTPFGHDVAKPSTFMNVADGVVEDARAQGLLTDPNKKVTLPYRRFGNTEKT